MHFNGDNLTYFDSFGVEHVQKEVKQIRDIKLFAASNFRVQANNSTMCGYFCIRFTDFMLKVKILLDYTNLFLPNEYEKIVKTNN